MFFSYFRLTNDGKRELKSLLEAKLNTVTETISVTKNKSTKGAHLIQVENNLKKKRSVPKNLNAKKHIIKAEKSTFISLQ